MAHRRMAFATALLVLLSVGLPLALGVCSSHARTAKRAHRRAPAVRTAPSRTRSASSVSTATACAARPRSPAGRALRPPSPSRAVHRHRRDRGGRSHEHAGAVRRGLRRAPPRRAAPRARARPRRAPTRLRRELHAGWSAPPGPGAPARPRPRSPGTGLRAHPAGACPRPPLSASADRRGARAVADIRPAPSGGEPAESPRATG
jgi:hypothetical protein